MTAKSGNVSDKGLRPSVTILLSIGTALLTSVFAPYFLEFTKNAEIRREHERDRNQKIVSTQYEIVERMNTLVWRYRQAAGFLMFDFAHGQRSELLERHLKEFEDASAEGNRELPTQAFRARMYFGSEQVREILDRIPHRIFYGVDDHISKQLLADKSNPHTDLSSSTTEWLKISKEIDEIMVLNERDLNTVFERIGKSGPEQDSAFTPR